MDTHIKGLQWFYISRYLHIWENPSDVIDRYFYDVVIVVESFRIFGVKHFRTTWRWIRNTTSHPGKSIFGWWKFCFLWMVKCLDGHAKTHSLFFFETSKCKNPHLIWHMENPKNPVPFVSRKPSMHLGRLHLASVNGDEEGAKVCRFGVLELMGQLFVVCWDRPFQHSLGATLPETNIAHESSHLSW